MRVVRNEALYALAAALVAGVSVQTNEIGDHLAAMLELHPVAVAEPDAEIVYTTSGTYAQVELVTWDVPVWLAQERTEAHAPEQEQPDR